MPTRWTVNHHWRKSFPEFDKAYIEARAAGYDAIANRTRTVARGQAADEDLIEGSSGDVQRDKLIIDTDLKLLAKWYPAKYGDRTIIAGDKKNPVEVNATTDLERVKAIVSALQAAKAKGA